MKKIFAVLIFCLMITGVGFAQERATSGFGIRAGINGSNIVTDGDNDFSFRFGPMAGVYARLGLFRNLTIQPELLYSLQGGEFEVEDPANNQQTVIRDRLHYLNLPVLAQFWLTNGLNIHAGPYVGLLLDVASDGRNTVSANYQRFDYGGTVGIEYEFPFGLNFGGRYNLGFYDIAGENHNVNATGPVIEGRNTNQFFQIYVGWTF
jgi:hypothetical protein